ncbi:pyridoxal 5'-phosphate synthase subunit PdxT [Capsulimonas corticalis]|uniref:Pyridoxal 5'-phosphate synthase subunit PdxT n=1 Tax=Capsulimonas corticalis TaxID=2219043 RepID=A0A402D4S7_9BACT|nr:pyridoxal 5'-phosphate synthase glutaminase subunit PdxT [Capsulimonas corticalis]BDI31964.1 pyridoxal 5'-phosphate synthase subunit PdxT [Capsulimonas corticalis]
MANSPKVAVVAMQGDYAKHIEMLQSLGADAASARLPREIEQADAIVIPGGESTTIGKMLARYGMDDAIKNAAEAGKPIYGTCAGLILLSQRIAAGTGERGGQPTLGLLDVTVTRNGFGRQTDSFETTVDAPEVSDTPLHALFIRAPYISEAGDGVVALASYEGKTVFVRQGKILATAFHPELVGDARVHRYFLSMIGQG